VTTKTFARNSMGQNIYLYYDKLLSEGVLIDAGCNEADCSDIAAFLREKGITVKAILLTHGHFDHIIAADEMRALTNAEIYCHCAEKPMLDDHELNLSTMIKKKLSVTPDKVLQDGDTFRFGNAQLEVLHTPGHTPGGVCYYDRENGNLFTGDTLFRESVGRTDLPQGNSKTLKKSIAEKLLTLPGSTVVYPGHGSSSTVGHEKQKNPFV